MERNVGIARSVAAEQNQEIKHVDQGNPELLKADSSRDASQTFTDEAH